MSSQRTAIVTGSSRGMQVLPSYPHTLRYTL